MIKITLVYKISNGKTYNSYNEALIAETLEQSKIFLENYKKDELIEELSTKLDVRVKDNEAD